MENIALLWRVHARHFGKLIGSLVAENFFVLLSEVEVELPIVVAWFGSLERTEACEAGAFAFVLKRVDLELAVYAAVSDHPNLIDEGSCRER